MRRNRLLGPTSAVGLFDHGVQLDAFRVGRRAPVKQTFQDTFTRSNGRFSYPWRAEASFFAVSSNAGVHDNTTASSIAMTTVDLGVPSFIIEWNMTTWPKGPVRSFFRYVDTNNYWCVTGTNSTATTMYLAKVVAGSFTIVATATGVTWGAGSTLRVETNAVTGLITVLVAGSVVSALTTTSTEFATATQAGIGGNRGVGIPDINAARWTRFYVEAM